LDQILIPAELEHKTVSTALRQARQDSADKQSQDAAEL
jgi:hypothetical protein